MLVDHTPLIAGITVSVSFVLLLLGSIVAVLFYRRYKNNKAKLNGNQKKSSNEKEKENNEVEIEDLRNQTSSPPDH